MYKHPHSQIHDNLEKLSNHSPSFDPFWHSKTFEEMALMQGVQPVTHFEDLLGGWPEEDINDNFEETLRHWRLMDVTISHQSDK